MQRIAFLTAALLAFTGTHAEEAAHRYAALSMIGDTITVYSQQQLSHTGSHLDQRKPEEVTLDRQFLDRTALQAIRSAILAIDAKASVALFVASPAAVSRDPRELLEGGKVRLAEQMLAAMKEDKATTLVLVTRYRSDEPIRGTSGRGYDAGALEGVGFYSNSQYRFDAPFVYLRVSLVNLDTLMVEREKLITANYVLSTRTGSNDDKHVAALVDLLKRQIGRALPPLLTGNDPKPRP